MRMFPQIDPWNVWNLPVGLWAVFERMADEWMAEQKAR